MTPGANTARQGTPLSDDEISDLAETTQRIYEQLPRSDQDRLTKPRILRTVAAKQYADRRLGIAIGPKRVDGGNTVYAAFNPVEAKRMALNKEFTYQSLTYHDLNEASDVKTTNKERLGDHLWRLTETH